MLAAAHTLACAADDVEPRTAAHTLACAAAAGGASSLARAGGGGGGGDRASWRDGDDGGGDFERRWIARLGADVFNHTAGRLLRRGQGAGSLGATLSSSLPGADVFNHTVDDYARSSAAALQQVTQTGLSRDAIRFRRGQKGGVGWRNTM